MSRDSPPHIKAANQEEGKIILSFYLAHYFTRSLTAHGLPSPLLLSPAVPLFFSLVPQRSQKKSATRIMRRVREMKRAPDSKPGRERKIYICSIKLFFFLRARLIIAFDPEREITREMNIIEILLCYQSSEIIFRKSRDICIKS